jgi:twitching motility protein PilT
MQEADDKETDVRSRLVDADAEQLLRLARELGASDLYLTPGEPPTIRLHGRLTPLPAKRMNAADCRALVCSLLNDKQIEQLDRRKHVDRSVAIEGGARYRANVFQHAKGTGGIFRVVADEVMPFGQLNLPSVVQDFVHFTHGLVLVTGATGSGKSTTLASLIDILNDTYQLHIVSLEDPIEVLHQSRKSLITQREIVTHSDTFASGLRAALREDPDVIVVGEMRDPETVATALTAAETGHLVMGTLHTRDAYSTILRVIDQFPVHKRSHVRTILARVLRAVVCQELIPTVEGNGRVLASEIMIVNPAISNLIREDRTWQINSVIQMSTNQGMQLMDDSLEKLLRARKISRRDASVRATEKERFEAMPSRG